MGWEILRRDKEDKIVERESGWPVGYVQKLESEEDPIQQVCTDMSKGTLEIINILN